MVCRISGKGWTALIVLSALILLPIRTIQASGISECIQSHLLPSDALTSLKSLLASPIEAEEILTTTRKIEAMANVIIPRLSDLDLRSEVQQIMNQYNHGSAGYLPGLTPEWNATRVEELIAEFSEVVRTGGVLRSTKLSNFRTNLQTPVMGFRNFIDQMPTDLVLFEKWRKRYLASVVVAELEKRLMRP